MAAPLAVDKEAVKVLVLTVGVREAARRMKLPEATVGAWSARGKWLVQTAMLASAISGAPTEAKDAIACTIPLSMRPTTPESHANGAITPSQALAESNADLSNRSRTATLKRGALVLEHSAKLAETDPEAALAQSADVASTVKSVAQAGDWIAKDSAPRLTLNLFHVTGEMGVERKAIDVEQA